MLPHHYCEYFQLFMIWCKARAVGTVKVHWLIDLIQLSYVNISVWIDQYHVLTYFNS